MFTYIYDCLKKLPWLAFKYRVAMAVWMCLFAKVLNPEDSGRVPEGVPEGCYTSEIMVLPEDSGRPPEGSAGRSL